MRLYDFAGWGILIVIAICLLVQLDKHVDGNVAEQNARARAYKSIGTLLEAGADWIDNSYEKPEPQGALIAVDESFTYAHFHERYWCNEVHKHKEAPAEPVEQAPVDDGG